MTRRATEWGPAELGVHPVADGGRYGLVACLREVSPGEVSPGEVSPGEVARAARWAADRVRLDDPWDLARLLEDLHAAGASDAVQALLDRDPAGQVSLDSRWDAVGLLGALHAAGAADAARALATWAASDADLEHSQFLARLLRALRTTGEGDASPGC
jgi:hypothetical protein